MKLLLLTLCLCLSGCMQDDVSDLKTLSEQNLIENNRVFYAAGVYDGMIMAGVPESDAAYWSELRADEVFYGY